MKFLIIGLGSMGKRRIRNLQFLGEKNIIGFDLSRDRCDEAKNQYGIEAGVDLKKIKLADFDAVIISTPPHLHGSFIKFAIKNKKHFFVEVATNVDGYKEILKSKNKNIIMAPSCTFRYFLPIMMLKKILDDKKIGKILAYTHHMGQYLPDWHPFEDYSKVYFSKKESGACREMFPFELNWLNWLVGSEIKKVQGYVAKISDLKMSADDIVTANLCYKNGVMGSVLIDVISHKPFRTLRILGSDGVLEWEWRENIIKLYNAKSQETEIIKVPQGNSETGYITVEEMYQDEMKSFLDAISGKAKYPYTFEEDFKNLKLFSTLEEVL